jgi:hypothetical protein
MGTGCAREHEGFEGYLPFEFEVAGSRVAVIAVTEAKIAKIEDLDTIFSSNV